MSDLPTNKRRRQQLMHEQEEGEIIEMEEGESNIDGSNPSNSQFNNAVQRSLLSSLVGNSSTITTGSIINQPNNSLYSQVIELPPAPIVYNRTGNSMPDEWKNKPVPTDLAEFLLNPYQYRVTEEFVNNTVIDVSNSYYSPFYFLI